MGCGPRRPRAPDQRQVCCNEHEAAAATWPEPGAPGLRPSLPAAGGGASAGSSRCSRDPWAGVRPGQAAGMALGAGACSGRPGVRGGDVASLGPRVLTCSQAAGEALAEGWAVWVPGIQGAGVQCGTGPRWRLNPLLPVLGPEGRLRPSLGAWGLVTRVQPHPRSPSCRGLAGGLAGGREPSTHTVSHPPTTPAKASCRSC